MLDNTNIEKKNKIQNLLIIVGEEEANDTCLITGMITMTVIDNTGYIFLIIHHIF